MSAVERTTDRGAHDSDWLMRLAARLSEPLPGPLAQARFEPELSFGRHYAPAPADAREAAVVALFYPGEGGWHLPLTVRPATMADHAGQVSFPGGAIDPGEDSRAAALRELEEELGVPSAGIELLGRLSPIYVFASNFAVVPWVAACRTRPSWQPNPREVAELLEVPLDHLLDRAHWGSHRRRVRDFEFGAPHIAFAGHQIWGATSMMLGELVAVVEDLSRP